MRCCNRRPNGSWVSISHRVPMASNVNMHVLTLPSTARAPLAIATSGGSVGDPIDRAAVVVGDEQGAVGRDQHVDRPAPDAAAVPLARHPAGREVLGLAGVAA